MSFIDVRLSDRVNAGFVGGPEWQTLVVAMANGRDRRRQDWTMPRHKFTADYTALDPVSQNEILTAFIAARGQMHTFGFKDWNDFKAKAQVIGQGDGTSRPVQLCKTYAFGTAAYVRPIKLPLVRTVRVYQDGARVDCEIDRLTGRITPQAPWLSGGQITADFEFNVCVRFSADYFPFTRNSHASAQTSVELVEDFGK